MSTSDDLTRTLEYERELYAAGYRAGAAAAMEAGCPHVHPQIAQSVREMFNGWDGAEAALNRSVDRLRAEHRQGVKA